MKKILLLLIAAMAMAMVIPAARANDKDNDRGTWRDAGNILNDLYLRMDAVNAKRVRYGADPRMRDQISRLHSGIADLTPVIHHHEGDPGTAKKDAQNLSGLMSRVEAEYRDRMRHGVEVHVDRA